ncbi:MAG: hypothetical protein WAR83_05645, partial [Flavobacteriales bacterium]
MNTHFPLALFLSEPYVAPFEPRSLKVQNKSNFQFGYSQVIQHLAKLMCGNSIDRLRFNYNGFHHDQIWDVFANLDVS